MPRSSDIRLSTRGTALKVLWGTTVLQILSPFVAPQKSSSSFCSARCQRCWGTFGSCYRAGTTRNFTDTSQALLSLREGFTTQLTSTTPHQKWMIRKIWKIYHWISRSTLKPPEMTLNSCCRLVSAIQSESPLSVATGVNFTSESSTSSTMMHNDAARLVGATFSATGEVVNSTHPAEIFIKRKIIDQHSPNFNKNTTRVIATYQLQITGFTSHQRSFPYLIFSLWH